MKSAPVSPPGRALALAFALALPLAPGAPALAQDEAVTPASVVAAAPDDEWSPIAPEDLLVIELAPDTDGAARRVIIQLAPPPFSQPWIGNIRQLATARWWDGTSVYRAVDNWVVQWGAGEGDGFAGKALPDGLASPRAPYEVASDSPAIAAALESEASALDTILSRMRGADGAGAAAQPYARDPYAPRTGFVQGWPFAASGTARLAWPVHCYGTVGVSRDVGDTGTGAELYAVIGHAPRQLDRNIAVVGRVIAGIEHFATLPRGTGEYGVYESRAQDTPIVSVRLGSEMARPPAFEYLATDSASFADYVAVRANRHDAFYEVPAGGVDICNIAVPVREAAR